MSDQSNPANPSDPTNPVSSTASQPTSQTSAQQAQEDLSDEIAALQEEVANYDRVIPGAVALINGIAAQVEATGGNKDKLKALVSKLHADATLLADAVAAKTPVAGQA